MGQSKVFAANYSKKNEQGGCVGHRSLFVVAVTLAEAASVAEKNKQDGESLDSMQVLAGGVIVV